MICPRQSCWAIVKPWPLQLNSVPCKSTWSFRAMIQMLLHQIFKQSPHQMAHALIWHMMREPGMWPRPQDSSVIPGIRKWCMSMTICDTVVSIMREIHALYAVLAYILRKDLIMLHSWSHIKCLFIEFKASFFSPCIYRSLKCIIICAIVDDSSYWVSASIARNTVINSSSKI